MNTSTSHSFLKEKTITCAYSFISNRLLVVIYLVIGCSLLIGCKPSSTDNFKNQEFIEGPHIVVLGIAQDAGYPQADCTKACCTDVWNNPVKRKMVSCLGLRIPASNQVYLFDATPDFKDQLQILKQDGSEELGGIFLTHAHIGHYTGLIHLGREVMGATSTKVHVMPRMKDFLSNNGPWDQLVNLENISLIDLTLDESISLENGISISALLVPHRDEYSETVGFSISGPEKSVLFIPDIDKWNLWNKDILEEIKKVDVAFLDGTFFKNGEIPGRDMSQIPHPFVEESMSLFDHLNEEDKAKVYFIHFNHTNPLLKNGKEREFLESKGYNLAEEKMVVEI